MDAKNEGTIDGMINVVSNKTYESNGTTEKALPEYLTYSVTYSDGKSIAPKQLLKAGSTEKYKVRVEFKDVAADKLPSSEETIKFKFSVDYVQADDTAQTIRLTETRYTTNKYINGNDNEFVEIGKKPTENITLYNTVAEAKNAFNNRPFYLKHTIDNDIVKESYVCFEKDGNTYCLRGLDVYDREGTCKTEEYPDCKSLYYESNKTILKQAFGESNCTDNTSYLHCSVSGLSADAYGDGGAYAGGGYAECDTGRDGYSACYEW